MIALAWVCQSCRQVVAEEDIRDHLAKCEGKAFRRFEP